MCDYSMNYPVRVLIAFKHFQSGGGERDGVCAKVRVRIVQELVLTREGFNARLEIENGETSARENINVEIEIRETYGSAEFVNDRFSIGKNNF